jgi:hypothetical protein
LEFTIKTSTSELNSVKTKVLLEEEEGIQEDSESTFGNNNGWTSDSQGSQG